MATTIRIDPDDELPAILERLRARDACILVLPPHARALNSVVGAKLLARRAQALETRVAVVSEDRAVTAHVRAAGIPVAESVAEAMRLLPAPLVFDEPTPTAAPVLSTEQAPAAPNGATEDEPHEAVPLARPVVEPQEGAPQDGAEGSAHRAQTVRFVARQPSSTPPDAAPGDATEADEADEAGRPVVRGHSGGARASRAARAAAATGGGGAGGRPAAARAQSTQSAAAPAAPVAAAPGRLREILASEGLTRLLVPILLGVILLLLLLWLIFVALGAIFNPSATLTVRQRALPITAATNPIVHTYAQTPPKKRAGPYTQLFSKNIPEEGTAQLPVNGTATLPGQVATGQISLRNPGAAPVVVPAGSAFTTRLNKQTFVTTKDVTVPGARLTFDGAEYGKAAVPIKAATGGAAGNVPAKTIVNVLPLLGGLFVTNTAGTTGGTDRHVKVPLRSDVTAAADKLFASLETKARQAIAALPIAGGVEQRTLFVARSPVRPVVNAAQTSATLKLSVVLHAVYVHKAGLTQAAQAAIGSPPNLITGSVAYNATWRPDNSIVLAPTARTAPPINPDTIRAAIDGQPKESARLYLDRQTNIATYTLDLSPGWADHVPTDLSHIHITVQPAQ